MDEFDFDSDGDSPESPSRSKSSPIKKCPQSPSNSSVSVSSSGSPLRGRRKNRKTRKVILTGAQAIKEGQAKRRQAEQNVAAAAAVKAAALEKKKRAAASTPSSNDSGQIKRQSSPEKKVISTKGRRHKQRKTERKNINSAIVDREISTEFACSQSSLDSKSVRFAESSKGKEHHNGQAERHRELGESESSSSCSSSATGKKPQQTQQQPSSCLRSKSIYPQKSSQSTKTNASKQTPPTSPASNSNSSISYSSFARIHGNGARKKRHKPRRFQLGYSPNVSSHHNESSVNSSPASSSSKSPEKTQVVTLGRSIGYSSRDFDTTPDAAAAAQNAGNYRMLIDELSYLCSAILHCKQQHRIGFAKTEVVCRHNSITAGAACDIGELISQSGTRTALLMLSSSSGGRAQQSKYKNGGKSVGALGAILEALACAPPVVDWVDVCKEVIIGDEVSDSKPSSLVEGSNATGFELDNNNLAAVPLSSLSGRTKFDNIASKALSIVSLFVSIDCTGSSRAAISPNCKMERNMIKGARNNILQHQQSLRGIARLISDDPVVNTYLQSMAVAQGVTGLNDGGELQLMDNVDEGSIASKSSRASTLSSISMSKASSQQTVDELSQSQANNADPTKAGRQRNRKRKKMMAIREDDDEKDSSEFNMASMASSKSSESPIKLNSPAKSGKSNCLDFNSADSSAKPNTFVKKVRLNSVEKYTEKLTLALSRAKIPTLDAKDDNDLSKSDDDKDVMCQHCQVWGKDALSSQSCHGNVCITSASLAIDAAECIITGKDISSGNGADDADIDERDDGGSDDDDFLADGNQNSEDEVSAKNPILFANEMLRKSGSLPEYSRAYASTLSAILLAHKLHHAGDQLQVPSTSCHRCITYLQKRASSLSGIIDSLCCLSPKASIALSCPESYLVPGLLKVIAELSFGNNMGAASTSIRDEILTSLKTLTSLTHENSVACEQLVRPYNWDNSLPISMENAMVASDQTTTGVCIIFSYLLKVSSTKQRNASTNHDDERDKSFDRYLYDTTIFCLNILTNIVEMVPHSSKYMIENIAVTDEGVNAITWLSRWVVSTTSGFRKSIMKGSFGSQGETEESTTGGDELKAGEEGNLVTAGNGFVLLAYLMLEDEHSSSSSASIRDAVIKELPFDESGSSGGIQYMIKTLKAFCNFYHYSVGDLSVAVIAPVVKLISGLQKLDVVEQRKAWL